MNNQASTPPKLATWFLHRFLRADLAEDVSGDLAERFNTNAENRSRFLAKVDYWYQVLAYLRPFAIRKLSYTNQNYIPMFQSYFITSIRGMKKNRLHAVINIAGLSVGMAVAMIIGLWIKDEVAYEKHFDKYNKIGRVLQHLTNNGEVGTWWSVPMPLAEELRKNYGDNFRHVVLTTDTDASVSYEDKNLTQTGVFAERDFCELFTLQMTRGSRGALKDPSSLIISETLAKTYFGDGDPIGKVMTLDKEMTVHVAGVYKDIPENSELKNVHFVAAWELLYNHTPWLKNMRDPWRPNPFTIYVAIADNHSFEQVSANIRDAKLKNVSAELAKKKPALFVHPMSQWHLYSRFRDGQQDGGLITYVWLFAIVAGFVVLMACINFMNLSTARSEKRAREVGIRKAIGSFRSQLIQQFFSESIVMALFAFVLALLMVQLSLPAFNLLAGKNTTLPWTDTTLWLCAIALCFFIGILSGSYPALYLSSITPGKALKGAFKATRFAALPRKVMVIVQFTVSVIMIIGTAVVFQQIQYAKDRPIGYDTNGLVAVQSNSKELHNHIDAVREELAGAGIISNLAEADAPTTELWSSTSAFDWNGKDPDLSVDFAITGISHAYGKTIGWEIVQGRDFTKEFLSDSIGLIINESAAHYMGLKEPVGETIRWYNEPYHVVGVIKDIVIKSPFEPVRPIFYFINPGSSNYVFFRIRPDQSAHNALTQIQLVYKKYSPGQPFDYRFVDEAYAQKFGNEERLGKLAGVFTSLAIFISCLGIFGLSSFVAEQRTKEFGIRKVHGASAFQLWKMVSADFVILVLIACFIALPIAYFLATKWVNRYDYHMSISWLILASAALCIIFITLLTVSWHTWQAAKMNPVKSLKAE